MPTTSETGDAEDAAGRAPSGVLELLHRTVQGLALYSSDHRSVRDAASALAREIATVLGAGGALRFGVTQSSFVLDGQEIASEGISQLAGILNKLDVAMLELHAGCTSDEMLAMACIVCDAGRAALRGEELATEIERATDAHVLVKALTFTGLSVRDGVGAGGGGSGAKGDGVEWGPLIDSLVSGAGHPVCAESVDRAVVDAGESAARDVGMRLVRACDDTRRMDGDAAARGRQRIHAFVQSMRPETRQRIVDCCLSSDSVGRPANGLGVATPGGTGVSPEMAELFGADEVLSSLDRLERAGVALAPETMKLFQKLSHLQPDPYDRDPGELPQDPELRDSVGELMGIRAKGEFTPSDYVEQIDACVSGPKTPGAAQWTLDDRQVLLQKAEIALELLREEKDSEGSGSDAIFRFLTDNLDFVIGAGRVDLLSRGVRAAQRRAYKSVSTDGEDGARELLAAIDDAERVTAILEAGGDAGSDCAELIALFREVDYLLARIPQILVESSSARANRAGAEVLLGMSEAHLRPLVEALARMDLAALRALLEVLIALPSSRLAALVEPLREDEDPRVRRLAYRALDAGGAAWGREVMRRALADDDLGVQRIALDHLRAKPDRGAIDTLTDYLRGDLAPGGVMWRSTYRHAAHLLADIEPDGESRVCEILFEGRSRLGRRNAARMREIASVLGDRDESDQAIRAMRRWSLSISRAVGAIAGARLPEGGEK